MIGLSVGVFNVDKLINAFSLDARLSWFRKIKIIEFTGLINGVGRHTQRIAYRPNEYDKHDADLKVLVKQVQDDQHKNAKLL